MFNIRRKFTLIELIVVIAVLGILSTIVVPNIKDIQEKAKVVQEESNVRNIQTSIDMYHLANQLYPSDIQPKVIENKENPDLTVVEKQPINFDLLTHEYLRDIPDKSNIYFVDGRGNAIINKKEESTPPDENIPPDIPKKGSTLIVELDGKNIDASCITLTEIEVYDKEGRLISYTVEDAYDSVELGQPYYWNTDIWNKENLNDEDKNYINDRTGGASSSAFGYRGMSDEVWARIALILPTEMEIGSVKVWAGSPQQANMNNLRVYVASSYEPNMISERTNKNLTLYSELDLRNTPYSVFEYTLE